MRRAAAFVIIGLLGMTSVSSSGALVAPTRWTTCGRFVEVASFERPGAYETTLNDVVHFGTRDAWAVGMSNVDGPRSLALHWDGWSWTPVALPRSDRPEGLLGVAILAADDVWAVGSRGDRPLAVHWNGRAWHRVAQPAGVRGQLEAVAPIPGTRQLWAVGADADRSALIERWNGRAWSVVPTPPHARDRGPLEDVVAFPRVAFAVGAGSRTGALAIRWNGHRWHAASVPHRVDTGLSGLAGIGPVKVWAVGARLGRALVLRWDHGWRTIWWSHRRSSLASMTVPAPGVVWSVGTLRDGLLALRRTGGTWAVDPAPRTDLPAGGRLTAIDGTPGDLWATGSGGNPEIPAVLLHRC